MKTKSRIKDKQKFIIISSIIVVAIVFVMGISYALWQVTKVQENTNIISSGCFDINLEGENPINLSSVYPISLEEGMNTTPYTFTITNVCDIRTDFMVNLESLDNTTFDSSSIRVALNENNKLYSEYEISDKYYENSKDARTLANGTLDYNESITYNLRLWINEEAPTTEQNKVFASKIVVISKQNKLIEPNIENLSATSTEDTIDITYDANGDIVPAICKWGIVEGIYDNEVNDANSNKCSITGLLDNTIYYYQICTETGKGNKCVEGSIITKQKTMSSVKIGDYISMTPTSTLYNISTDLTGSDLPGPGLTSNQSINPSELNLWRVIRKNEDGTVDVVSEYVSSKKVYFYGQTGYFNFVGTLNTIAEQYTNEKYVSKTRHVGYSNQKEKCTSLSATSCPNDSDYEIDTNLIQISLGTLVGHTPSNTTVSAYWLPSRNGTYEGYIRYYYGLQIGGDGSVEKDSFYSNTGRYDAKSASIRPILTLKSDIIIISGDGKNVDTAYKFE